MTEHDDAVLLELLRRSAPDLWSVLYARLGSTLYAVARSMTPSRADAEDAVQQAFLELYRSREAFARAERPRAYALRAVHHAALRVRARGARSEALEGAPEPSSREPACGADERDPRLDAAVAALPEEQRDVLALRLDGELTFAEIGATLGLPEDTVASRYRRALERLRERLGGTR